MLGQSNTIILIDRSKTTGPPATVWFFVQRFRTSSNCNIGKPAISGMTHVQTLFIQGKIKFLFSAAQRKKAQALFLSSYIKITPYGMPQIYLDLFL